MEGSRPFKNRHILVIDDNQVSIEVMVQMLEVCGVTYTTLEDPRLLDEILPEIQQHIDLVFLDLEMPGLNGYKVLEVLRQTHKIEAPIVAYSVHLNEIEMTRVSGFDGFLGKPLSIDQFPERLSRLLQGEHLWEAI